MRKKKYTFTVKMHEEFGTLGFAPSWYKAGDPLSGMAVAHDILEHFPNDTGTAEEEYQALGASLWIRGQSGYYSKGGRQATPEENVASDMPTIWGIQNTVRPCALSKDESLMESCREAVEHFKKECQYMEGSTTPTEEQFEHIARWLAKGYKRAEKRYAKHGCSAIAWSLFEKIEEQADKALKHAEEGMILTVLIDWRQGMLDTYIDCDYPYEPEEEY